MTKAVWKFQLKMSGDGVTEINAPVSARPVLFARQGENWFVWCEVDLKSSTKTKCFRVFGAGHEIEDPAPGPTNYSRYEHVMSAEDEPFVWHLYELVHYSAA